MLSATAAAKAILATGQYLRADLFEFTLLGGAVYRFTSLDKPLVVGGNTYANGITIQRSGVTRKIGLDSTPFTLTMTPQLDFTGGQPTFGGGLGLVQAVRAAQFQRATVLFSKLFLSSWDDTSPGAVPWWKGRVNKWNAGRATVELHCTSFADDLSVAMPRNVLQTGCAHTLFDAGCTLVKASFTTAGAVTATGPNSILSFTTNLGAASTYYELGVITFTSGANNGLSRTVKSYANSNGVVTLIQPLPNVPATSDTFTIYPGCDKRQATCSTKFSNLAHFRGYPYVPQPETLYSGGAGGGDPTVSDDPIIGSTILGNMYPGSYTP